MTPLSAVRTPAHPVTADRTLSACIVDDEELARRGVRSRLSSHADITVTAECTSGREAVEALRTKDLDLVFLDVQMPGLDGFDVIEAVGPDAMPVTIFVTAYDEYALRAFDVHALDYLLKPLDEERFAEALDHARSRIAEQAAGEFGERLAALVSKTDPEEADEGPTDRFVVKSGGRVTFVKAANVQWVEAAGDYVQLHTDENKHLLRKTMKEMEAALDPDQFLRIHRSTIVNVDYLQEMRPYGSNNEYTVVLKDGTRRKLSRTYRGEVDEFFDGAL
ncbi:LytR/AlgR family response regulator transcription factor [Longibacter sp.]|uniref:LytR/AlgR family response regulator transcription factor n=1 Tax=Longibacter sp. TaxID=2045415 RepID=UPI003EB7E170